MRLAIGNLSGQKPDRFFRDLGGMLADSNEDETTWLRDVLLAARRAGTDSASVTLTRASGPDGGFAVHFVTDGGGNGEHAARIDPRGVFAALQRHGLAISTDHSPTGTPGETVELTLGQLRRMLQVLNVN